MVSVKTLFIVDGHALAYRAFYALPPLTAPDGRPTGAVIGFLRKLFKILRERGPDHLAVVFDSHERTFRDDLSPDYKATREAMPGELRSQIDLLREIVPGLGISVLCEAGVEADDVIASLAVAAQTSCRVEILSGDKDLASIVTDRITLIAPSREIDDDRPLDPAGVLEKYGVRPEQIRDYLSIMGDTSDNIPGVPGIGKKGAVDLLTEFGSIHDLLERIDNVRPALRKKLESGADSLALSRKLVELRMDVPLPFMTMPDDISQGMAPRPETLRLIEELAMRTVLTELKSLSGASAEGDSPRTYTSFVIPAALILAPPNLAEYLGRLSKAPIAAVDTETTSLDTRSAELIGVSFAADGAPPAYLPVFEKHNSGRAACLPVLANFLADDAARKCGHNMKYDLQIFRTSGIRTSGFVFDTMVASSILSPLRRSHSLDSLALELFGHTTIPFESLGVITEADVNQIAEYAAEDAYLTLKFHEEFAALLEKDEKLHALYEKIECPLVPVLADMEWIGVSIDPGVLSKLSRSMTKELEALHARAVEEAGEDFNPASPKQLGTILFDKLGLPTKKKTKTGYSTNVDVLETLRGLHPLPGLILEYREVAKLLSTYVDAIPKLINAGTGRVHTSFSQIRTATGRLASTDPNLQNIPIRTERGREIRRAIVAPRGNVLISADYSQIEFRIAAWMAKEEPLLDAFKKGWDLHSATASKVWGIPIDKVGSEDRRRAKAVNFGILYGQSSFGLARALGVSFDEAQGIIDGYFAGFPRMKAWIDEQLESARATGEAVTWFGRRRRIPDIMAANRSVREAAERIAINTPVQGTAAEIIKIAMINLSRELENFPGSAIILQVHDELVIETAKRSAEKIEALARQTMRAIPPFDEILDIAIGRGANWLEAEH